LQKKNYLENLTTNSTPKQSKSIEISKNLASSYHMKKNPRSGSHTTNLSRERKGEKNLFHFLEKRKDEELIKGGIGLSSSGPTSSTMTMRPQVLMAFSFFGRSVTARPYGIGTSSSSGRTAIAGPCGTGTSSSPNSSLILSNVI
jgi:hypothetical protein